MNENAELIVFSQNKIGGVQNFYRNILSNDPYNTFKKLWIFTDIESHRDTRLPTGYKCTNEIFFYIKENETTYSFAKRLESLITDSPGAILTNFPVELSTLHLFRKKNKTIYFISHDEAYFETAQRFDFLIDVFITHNQSIFQDLKKLLPHRSKEIFYLPYGVVIPSGNRKVNEVKELTVTIISRMSEKKGIFDLPLIDDLLVERNIVVRWNIVGMGPDLNELLLRTKSKPNFFFHQPSMEEGVLQIAKESDVFILPSRLDGLPVALLEAMSVGCVPIVSKFNEGIKKVVTQDEGFVLPVGNNEAFADAIDKLDKDRLLLEALSKNSRKRIVEEFDIEPRAQEYFNLFNRYKELKLKPKKKIIFYHGFLGHPAIPSFVRNTLRKIICR